MKILAVTACPTGIAHTYMAADALIKAAAQHSVSIQVETQGAMGIENKLSYQDIHKAECILIVSDIKIEQDERFEGLSQIKRLSIEEVLLDPNAIIEACLAHAK